jgi:CDGSH-type Zn-finger protein
MKTTAILAILFTSASAFTTQPFGRPQTAIHEKINKEIDLESPKVVNMEEVTAGDKKVYCRCWKSGTFPLCDAAHVTHNKENGKK